MERVEHEPVVDQSDSDRPDEDVERAVGQGQRGRRPVDRQDVGIVGPVGGQHRGDDLSLLGIAVGEQRPQRAVDQTAR